MAGAAGLEVLVTNFLLPVPMGARIQITPPESDDPEAVYDSFMNAVFAKIHIQATGHKLEYRDSDGDMVMLTAMSVEDYVSVMPLRELELRIVSVHPSKIEVTFKGVAKTIRCNLESETFPAVVFEAACEAFSVGAEGHKLEYEDGDFDMVLLTAESVEDYKSVMPFRLLVLSPHIGPPAPAGSFVKIMYGLETMRHKLSQSDTSESVFPEAVLKSACDNFGVDAAVHELGYQNVLGGVVSLSQQSVEDYMSVEPFRKLTLSRIVSPAAAARTVKVTYEGATQRFPFPQSDSIVEDMLKIACNAFGVGAGEHKLEYQDEDDDMIVLAGSVEDYMSVTPLRKLMLTPVSATVAAKPQYPSKHKDYRRQDRFDKGETKNPRGPVVRDDPDKRALSKAEVKLRICEKRNEITTMQLEQEKTQKEFVAGAPERREVEEKEKETKKKANEEKRKYDQLAKKDVENTSKRLALDIQYNKKTSGATSTTGGSSTGSSARGSSTDSHKLLARG
jgi:hypothetical protein